MRLDYIDNVDCLDGLKEVPDQSVDLIVADPPYFLSMGHAGDRDNARNKLLHAGGGNVWRIPAFTSGAKTTNGEKIHPTQKPVELITKAIEDATDPGAVVLDPFMGSGTTAVSAIRTGRHYIGFELDEKYHATAVDRADDELLHQIGAETEEDWLA